MIFSGSKPYDEKKLKELLRCHFRENRLLIRIGVLSTGRGPGPIPFPTFFGRASVNIGAFFSFIGAPHRYGEC